RFGGVYEYVPAVPTAGAVGSGISILFGLRPYQSATPRMAAIATHGKTDRSLRTDCATTGAVSTVRAMSGLPKCLEKASSNDAGSAFRTAGASLRRKPASEVAVMPSSRTLPPMKVSSAFAPSESTVPAIPEPRPASRPIRSVTQLWLPPNSDDRKRRPVDISGDAGSVSWLPVMEDSALAGVRDAVSMT